MIVENIIPRNVIINRGEAEVDNHISRDDFFDYHSLINDIFIYYTAHYSLFFLPFIPLTSGNEFATNGWNESFTKGLCL